MDLDRVENLVKLFGASRARELTVEAEGWHISFRREGVPSVAPPMNGRAGPLSSLLVDPGPVAPETTTVTAPLVGIFRQGNGGIEVGDLVRAGETVGGIESMKILSPVLCEASGQVLEILIEDCHPVDYGQPLFVLTPLPEVMAEEAGEWAG